MEYSFANVLDLATPDLQNDESFVSKG